MSRRPTDVFDPAVPHESTNVILPDAHDGPAFSEPWQAEAFATAVVLSRTGLFSWKEWTEAIGREIKDRPQRADEDANTAYHRQWLSTLEGILCRHGLISPSEVSDVMEHWRRSYVSTPHGSPVEFRRDWASVPPDALSDNELDHHHHHHHHSDDA